MKKTISGILIMTFSFFLLFSCKKEEPKTYNFELNLEEKTIETGEQLDLLLLVNQANKDDTITWYSSRIDVVSIDKDGIAKGLKEGSSTIVGINQNGAVDELTIKVNYLKIEDISLNLAAGSLIQGEQLTLDYTKSPLKAIIDSALWSSEDNLVATVDQNGVVSAINPGTTKIVLSATQKDKVIVKKFNLNVIGLPLDQIQIKYPTNIYDSDEKALILSLNNSYEISYLLNPSNAINKDVNYSVEVDEEEENIIDVTLLENNKINIEANKLGRTTLRIYSVENNNCYDEIDVIVEYVDFINVSVPSIGDGIYEGREEIKYSLNINQGEAFYSDKEFTWEIEAIKKESAEEEIEEVIEISVVKDLQSPAFILTTGYFIDPITESFEFRLKININFVNSLGENEELEKIINVVVINQELVIKNIDQTCYPGEEIDLVFITYPSNLLKEIEDDIEFEFVYLYEDSEGNDIDLVLDNDFFEYDFENSKLKINEDLFEENEVLQSKEIITISVIVKYKVFVEGIEHKVIKDVDTFNVKQIIKVDGLEIFDGNEESINEIEIDKGNEVFVLVEFLNDNDLKTTYTDLTIKVFNSDEEESKNVVATYIKEDSKIKIKGLEIGEYQLVIKTDYEKEEFVLDVIVNFKKAISDIVLTSDVFNIIKGNELSKEDIISEIIYNFDNEEGENFIDFDLVWTTNEPQRIVIKEDSIYAKGIVNGATVTIKSSCGFEKTFRVTVNAYILAQSIYVDKSDVEIVVGGSKEIKVTINPIKTTSKDLDISVDNEGIILYDIDNKDLTINISGVSVGIVNMIIKVGKHQITCTIKVVAN